MESIDRQVWMGEFDEGGIESVVVATAVTDLHASVTALSLAPFFFMHSPCIFFPLSISYLAPQQPFSTSSIPALLHLLDSKKLCWPLRRCAWRPPPSPAVSLSGVCIGRGREDERNAHVTLFGSF
jgi:hypothetical protein